MTATTMSDDDLMRAIVKEFRDGSAQDEDGQPIQGLMTQAIQNIQAIIASFRLHHSLGAQVHRAFNGLVVGDRVLVRADADMSEEAEEYIGRDGVLKLFDFRRAWVSFPSGAGDNLVRFRWEAIETFDAGPQVIGDAGFGGDAEAEDLANHVIILRNNNENNIDNID